MSLLADAGIAASSAGCGIMQPMQLINKACFTQESMPGSIACSTCSDCLVERPQTVHENLRMSSAMLSRFDLVFLLLDRPDEALDHSLSEHVLALHSGEPPQAWAAFNPSAMLVMYPTGVKSALQDGVPCCCDLLFLLQTFYFCDGSLLRT